MDPHALLRCWERGRRRHALDRALLLHAAAVPDADPETLADRPIGERNAALLRLRRALFGDDLASCVECPACCERLEFSLSAGALLERAPADPAYAWIDGVRVRMPTTRDLVSITGERDDAAAARALLARLVDGTSIDAGSDAALAARVTHALDEADPCLDISIDMACPACAHAWSAAFDVAGFVWEEIDARARRLLDEVHVLAGAYGWTEAEILGLSDVRRGAYLERTLA
jgi:hypothetical protein